jgi:hypothetical protein
LVLPGDDVFVREFRVRKMRNRRRNLVVLLELFVAADRTAIDADNDSSGLEDVGIVIAEASGLPMSFG